MLPSARSLDQGGSVEVRSAGRRVGWVERGGGGKHGEPVRDLTFNPHVVIYGPDSSRGGVPGRQSIYHRKSIVQGRYLFKVLFWCVCIEHVDLPSC